ncbi:unnamed protein product [Ranitomeya imitator]|uniref:Reverse transcriptase domain-containing protein n=1 Tax=Ranitomeya imitator TaxID=111125 RepID=A0ABN9LF52_9NEOB|nr:unnamed protein product [Ranitomeya imitator]
MPIGGGQLDVVDYGATDQGKECSVKEPVSTFLEWVARKITRQTVITHYLDDFLIVGPAGSDVCSTALAQFKDAMEHFGVPLSPEKTIGPVSVITFLGI